ncbi:TPA: TatD family deoxyribonuclease [Candidatus Gastranaerophilales bacterium HUM_3]|jgi:hydrolase, tatD family|nr:TatD family hydrolase [Acinetobacter sp.]CCZ50817.1 tatD family deoxyribonuclease [Acinetobacter sp. CAG:196]DAA85715.1 MAG TPA: TatD family deoxyribonuclease [Candidatus Gastranaerophilales bacterium HUM_3]DAB00963.1 MAG TPA: TatD family deoxyribonuclease [Candidatus Gastranaerophilales bacterium HUM_10]DAB13653.1 MAG TPA: TatD family deoxyribonuclease [Candidatus Gastranaerophilales bacterium HUM_16]DAB15536.1 MAG TPA: TatD family deoxyribonuclease [Candidatus Gastranaerophilales bacteriu
MKEYLIDTHAHIDMLEAPIESTLQLMKDFGVKKAVIPSVEVSSMEKVIAAAEADENIYAMIGIYPSEAKTYTQEVEDRMIELAKNHKVKAVGEIGLDYYWDKSFVDLQKEVYVKQILLANKLNLPIVIHDREAHKDAYDLLLEYNQSSKALFHCFSGSVEFMRECVKKGWYIALGGVVTFKNAVKMKDVAREIPLDKLVLETDSPYLTPVPFRGKPNTPAYVRYVAEEIANLRQIPLNELIDITTNNAERFFEI